MKINQQCHVDTERDYLCDYQTSPHSRKAHSTSVNYTHGWSSVVRGSALRGGPAMTSGATSFCPCTETCDATQTVSVNL